MQAHIAIEHLSLAPPADVPVKTRRARFGIVTLVNASSRRDDWFLRFSCFIEKKRHDTQAPGAGGSYDLLIIDHRSNHYTYLKEPGPGKCEMRNAKSAPHASPVQ